MSKKCSNCGKVVDDTVKFCPDCGNNNFQSEVENAQNVNSNQQNVVPTPQPVAPVVQQNVVPTPQPVASSPKPPKKGMPIWAIVLIVVLSVLVVLSALGVGGYLVYDNYIADNLSTSKDKDEDKKNEEEVEGTYYLLVVDDGYYYEDSFIKLDGGKAVAEADGEESEGTYTVDKDYVVYIDIDDSVEEFSYEDGMLYFKSDDEYGLVRQDKADDYMTYDEYIDLYDDYNEDTDYEHYSLSNGDLYYSLWLYDSGSAYLYCYDNSTDAETTQVDFSGEFTDSSKEITITITDVIFYYEDDTTESESVNEKYVFEKVGNGLYNEDFGGTFVEDDY